MHVIQIIGDSIASGKEAGLSNCPPQWSSPTVGVFEYAANYNMGSVPVSHDFCYVKPFDRYGSELTLAPLMLQKWGTNNSCIVRTSYPGYKLHADYAPGGFCYPNIALDFDGAAVNFQNPDSRPYKLEGVVVYLGQNDATSSVYRDAYSTNMSALAANLRTWAGATNLAIVYYGLNTNSTRTYASAIRAIQNNVATNDAYGALLTDDSDPLTDGVHPTIEGYMRLGEIAWSCLTNIWSRN